MRSSLQIIQRALLAVALLFSAQAVAAPSAEYQLKASYIYHFTKFVEWPPEAKAADGKFYICLLGSDPFGRAIDALEGKPASSGDIRVQRHGDTQGMKHCHVTYVGLENAGARDAALAALTREGSLTIGEGDAFLERGGVLRFVTVNDRVRFEINEQAAKGAKLRVGAKLMSVAIRK